VRRIFTYNWLHIPTGTRGTRDIELFNRNDLYELLNTWNYSNPGVWQYWE